MAGFPVCPQDGAMAYSGSVCHIILNQGATQRTGADVIMRKNKYPLASSPHGLLLTIAACMALAPMGMAQAGLPGDVNLDGAVNVLDVQASINMALGVTDQTQEADADVNSVVDVLDVQALVNTSLGTGGLVQPVAGYVPGIKNAANLQVIAVSLDGRVEKGAVDPVTGGFELLLGVRTAWSLALAGEMNGAWQTLATLSFPIAGDTVLGLPIPELSDGDVIYLGEVFHGVGDVLADDVRTLLARLADPLTTVDADTNGLPDFLETLFGAYLEDPAVLGVSLPTDLEGDLLHDLVGTCLGDSLDGEIPPDLSGAEDDGIPDFLDPAVQCLTSGVSGWLDSSIFPIPQELIDIYNQYVVEWVSTQMIPWLVSQDRPELSDANGNWIPDFVEEWLCTPGSCVLDANGDALADFAQDNDGDGIPNLFDADAWTDADTDGDGVANDFDWDDDGDGIPDYAEPPPPDAGQA